MLCMKRKTEKVEKHSECRQENGCRRLHSGKDTTTCCYVVFLRFIQRNTHQPRLSFLHIDYQIHPHITPSETATKLEKSAHKPDPIFAKKSDYTVVFEKIW